MKTLFICQANTGRSQVAMSFYNQLHDQKADSAGITVDIPGQQLFQRQAAINILSVMQEQMIDMSNNVRTQLTQAMADDYDRLIVMAEPEVIPTWLRDHKKTNIWTITDAKGLNLEATRTIVAQIKAQVKLLQ
jgi:protein-tyrosine-phosphatase